MKLIKNILILVLLISPLLSKGQTTVPITDDGFRQYLLDNIPQVMDINEELILDSASTYYGSIDAGHYDIHDVSALQYFTRVWRIRIIGNDFSYVPDLSTHTSLWDLHLDSNNIDSMAPVNGIVNLQNLKIDANNLSELPDVSGLNRLYRIFCRANNLSSFPDLTGCDSLYHIICTFNNFSTLPDFSNIPLDRLICHNNPITYLPDYSLHPDFADLLTWNCKLTFDDILVMTNHPNYATEYHVFDQDSVETDTLYNVVEMEDLTIDLGFDDTVTTNTYSWYKNGTFITSTSVNSLTINDVSISDSGTYHVVVTNSHPLLSGEQLITKEIRVNVFSCLGIDNASYDIISENCEAGVTAMIDESSLTISSPPVSYSIINKTNTSDTVHYSSPEITNLASGTYHIVIKDVNNCAANIQNFIVVQQNPDCDPTFTPNGDGNNDTYFVNQNGLARVYNVAGELINEFPTPAYWDGTTADGADAPMGYYAIIINESEVVNVTLVR